MQVPELSLVDAIDSRRSIRRFLPDAVPEAVVRDILERAARAPSGSNIQPWKVRVVTGAARQRLVDAVSTIGAPPPEDAEYRYYPDDWFEPYLSRRRACGLGLYQLLGLTREDKAGMAAQQARNHVLFDAPVGLFFSMDRRMNQGSWLDMGMFIGNVMLLARAHGLETCPQAAWVGHGATIHRVLEMPDDEIFLCAVCLGVEDVGAPENTLRTDRAPVDEFTLFLR
ncbi:nitroreductase [Hoeflea sp.]|uniref:nitroreductase n=1 Tax=Hoeflea sp. TaxID=1940281 RepID=UPI0019B7A49C|nr:nitroreductase [Hoeflea sp.]MBC7286424.1 nitroreductase [Hoeflea sp.]